MLGLLNLRTACHVNIRLFKTYCDYCCVMTRQNATFWGCGEPEVGPVIPKFKLGRDFVGLVHSHHFPIEKNRAKMPKNARNHARNSPFPFRHVHFHLTHEWLGPSHSPPQTASGSSQPCCHCSHVRIPTDGPRESDNGLFLLAILIESDALIIFHRV